MIASMSEEADQSWADQYRAIRLRLRELVAGLDESQVDAEVPARPGWRVRDIVAHLVGVANDIATGNTADAPGDRWAAAHVERGRSRSVEELLHDWDDAGAVLETLLAAAPPDLGTMVVTDVTTHELDVRAALTE